MLNGLSEKKYLKPAIYLLGAVFGFAYVFFANVPILSIFLFSTFALTFMAVKLTDVIKKGENPDKDFFWDLVADFMLAFIFAAFTLSRRFINI